MLFASSVGSTLLGTGVVGSNSKIFGTSVATSIGTFVGTAMDSLSESASELTMVLVLLLAASRVHRWGPEPFLTHLRQVRPLIFQTRCMRMRALACVCALVVSETNNSLQHVSMLVV